MICNKKEWEILDDVQVTLLKFAPMMNERDKARVNALIYLCAESTKAEKARNEKSAQRIKERRKENPDYARPKRERRLNKMNKFDIVENAAKELETNYNTAFDLVYCSDVIYDETENDDSL